jgi:hypothetical protein
LLSRSVFAAAASTLSFFRISSIDVWNALPTNGMRTRPGPENENRE